MERSIKLANFLSGFENVAAAASNPEHEINKTGKVSIRPQDIKPIVELARITNFKVVASYNWLDVNLATILVPGIPPLWNPPAVSKSLSPDEGGRFVDQNADQNPGSPLEVFLTAIHAVDPSFGLFECGYHHGPAPSTSIAEVNIRNLVRSVAEPLNL